MGGAGEQLAINRKILDTKQCYRLPTSGRDVLQSDSLCFAVVFNDVTSVIISELCLQ